MQTLHTHLKTAKGGYLDAEPELLLSGHAVHEGLPVLEAVLDEVNEEGESQHKALEPLHHVDVLMFSTICVT